MIVDIHTHLAYYKLYPDKFLEGMFSNDNDQNLPLQKKTAIVKLFLKDKDCSQLLKQMDTAQIEKAALMVVDDNEYLGKTDLSIEENYLLHYEILRKHPGRFVVFAGYHPKRSNSGLCLLKKGIESYGFSGVKFYPPYGFKIDDPQLSECYEYCDKLSLPVLIHTGHSLNGLVNENAEPHSIGQVAEQYQNISFIMAHAGYKLKDSVISKLLLKKNIYADISGFQSVVASENGKETLKLIFQEPYNSKILFGSDWPITNLLKPLANQVNAIKEIAENNNNKADNALENVLRNNALKVLKF